ncbi:MAG: hypothetical protein E3K36_07955 [Candidatus Brocadia sp.]|nr:hypothetical protein [Candidatus Brocadia sp.]
MRKTLTTIGGCLFAFILSAMIIIDSADAGSGSGGRHRGRPKHAPEPISFVLFAAGGGTLVGLRYLRNRRRSKELNSQDSNVKDVVS